MVTKITYEHFCNLGALCNPHCFTRVTDRGTEYFYEGNLSNACWMGYNHTSPKGA